MPDVVLKPVQYVGESDDRKREADLDRHLDPEGPAPAPEIHGTDDVGDLDLEDDYYVQEALGLLKGANILSRANTRQEDQKL